METTDKKLTRGAAGRKKSVARAPRAGAGSSAVTNARLLISPGGKRSLDRQRDRVRFSAERLAAKVHVALARHGQLHASLTLLDWRTPEDDLELVAVLKQLIRYDRAIFAAARSLNLKPIKVLNDAWERSRMLAIVRLLSRVVSEHKKNGAAAAEVELRIVGELLSVPVAAVQAELQRFEGTVAADGPWKGALHAVASLTNRSAHTIAKGDRRATSGDEALARFHDRVVDALVAEERRVPSYVRLALETYSGSEVGALARRILAQNASVPRNT